MSQCYDDFRSFIEGNEGWKKGFKSMSFEIALFPQIMSQNFPYARDFLLIRFFFKFCFKSPCFQISQNVP